MSCSQHVAALLPSLVREDRSTGALAGWGGQQAQWAGSGCRHRQGREQGSLVSGTMHCAGTSLDPRPRLEPMPSTHEETRSRCVAAAHRCCGSACGQPLASSRCCHQAPALGSTLLPLTAAPEVTCAGPGCAPCGCAWGRQGACGRCGWAAQHCWNAGFVCRAVQGQQHSKTASEERRCPHVERWRIGTF